MIETVKKEGKGSKSNEIEMILDKIEQAYCDLENRFPEEMCEMTIHIAQKLHDAAIDIAAGLEKFMMLVRKEDEK